MIPLKDENQTGKIAWLTITLVIINAMIFIVSMSFNYKQTFIDYGFIPAKFSLLDISTYLQVFTSMFLHASWIHLIGNMLSLYIFGDNIEDKMGKVLYLSLYLLFGVAAVLAQYIIDTDSAIPLVGASGAISGIMGLYLILFPHTSLKLLVINSYGFHVTQISARSYITIWLVIQVISSITLFSGVESGVAFMAHVGGAFAGVITGYMLKSLNIGTKQIDKLHEFGL